MPSALVLALAFEFHRDNNNNFAHSLQYTHPYPYNHILTSIARLLIYNSSCLRIHNKSGSFLSFAGV